MIRQYLSEQMIYWAWHTLFNTAAGALVCIQLSSSEEPFDSLWFSSSEQLCSGMLVFFVNNAAVLSSAGLFIERGRGWGKEDRQWARPQQISTDDVSLCCSFIASFVFLMNRLVSITAACELVNNNLGLSGCPLPLCWSRAPCSLIVVF